MDHQTDSGISSGFAMKLMENLRIYKNTFYLFINGAFCMLFPFNLCNRLRGSDTEPEILNRILSWVIPDFKDCSTTFSEMPHTWLLDFRRNFYFAEYERSGHAVYWQNIVLYCKHVTNNTYYYHHYCYTNVFKNVTQIARTISQVVPV